MLVMESPTFSGSRVTRLRYTAEANLEANLANIGFARREAEHRRGPGAILTACLRLPTGILLGANVRDNAK